MKKFAYVAVAAFAAFLVTLGFTSSAQAYPDVRISAVPDKLVVNAGDPLTVTATSSVDCSWGESWNDEGHASAGTKFVTTYVAPAVSKITKIPLTATCAYGAAATGTQTWKHQTTITVLPVANGAAAPPQASSDLPNSGGPNRVFLLSGLVLLLAGATAVTVARRRAEAELPAQTA